MASSLTTDQLHAKLEAYWVAVRALRPDSPDADYQAMASYIAPDASLYFHGINTPPAIGPQGAIDEMRRLTTYWHLEERRVRMRATDGDRTVVAEMDNSLLIQGVTVQLKELEIVEFDDQGLIKSYRLYVNPNPVAEALAKAKAEKEATTSK
ncbi:hypothetical protein F4810DRAFT_649131 [Camillea tinctor]|nr:hypothetical protein F4810DRAFT_649131 [Camillea tinctor]